MKYYSIFPMQSYWGKYLGGLICLVAILGIALILSDLQHVLVNVMPIEKQAPGILLLFASGMFIFNFSKERVDDERVRLARYTAFRAALYLHFISLFIYFFAPLLSNERQDVDHTGYKMAEEILFLLVVPQVLYQLIFQIGLRLDAPWIHSDNSVEENMGNNAIMKYLMIVIITVGAGLLIYLLLNK